MVPYITCQYIANPTHPTNNGDKNALLVLLRTIAKFINIEGGIVLKPFPKSIKNPKLS
jgi:hypothetical protein